METTSNFNFKNYKEEKNETLRLNISSLIFGVVALVSSIGVSDDINSLITPIELKHNSIQSFKLTNTPDKGDNITLHNDQSSNTLITHFIKQDDIINSETDMEMEDLDVEELNRLQNSFDDFSKQNHENQLKMTKTLATLTSQMESVNKEIVRLNETQQNLPENIKTELAKLQVEKSDNNKSVWIAPTITGVIIGLTLLFGEQLLNFIF